MNAGPRPSWLSTFCVVALFLAAVFNPGYPLLGFAGFVLSCMGCAGSFMVPRAGLRVYNLITLLAFNLLCLAFLYAA